jgi:hypothetical protein
VTYLERAAQLQFPSLPAGDWSRFDRADLTVAAEAWSARAVQERCSASVFATIAAGLATLPVPLALLAALARIVDDEIRHATLCRQLARELGRDDEHDDLAAAERRLHPPGRSPASAALSLLLAEGAVGETLSAATFAAIRVGTREPRTRAALSLILRDEARHARTCWEALAVLSVETAAARTQLAADLSHELGVVELHSILPALKRVEAGELGTRPRSALGILAPLKRAEVFYANLEGNVFARLGRLGIDGPAVWAARYQGAPEEPQRGP